MKRCLAYPIFVNRLFVISLRQKKKEILIQSSPRKKPFLYHNKSRSSRVKIKLIGPIPRNFNLCPVNAIPKFTTMVRTVHSQSILLVLCSRSSFSLWGLHTCHPPKGKSVDARSNSPIDKKYHAQVPVWVLKAICCVYWWLFVAGRLDGIQYRYWYRERYDHSWFCNYHETKSSGVFPLIPFITYTMLPNSRWWSIKLKTQSWNSLTHICRSSRSRRY